MGDILKFLPLGVAYFVDVLGSGGAVFLRYKGGGEKVYNDYDKSLFYFFKAKREGKDYSDFALQFLEKVGLPFKDVVKGFKEHIVEGEEDYSVILDYYDNRKEGKALFYCEVNCQADREWQKKLGQNLVGLKGKVVLSGGEEALNKSIYGDKPNWVNVEGRYWVNYKV